MFAEDIPQFDSASRVLLVAPHPDDEALACGVTLQRAVRSGALIRVVYATDGDNNPWPQRLIERKWRLNATDRKRWGQLRRVEALSALEVLGVPSAKVQFLGLPDQGLTTLLKQGCQDVIDQLGNIIRDFLPTHLIIPSVTDTHPDHNAMGVMLHAAIKDIDREQVQMVVLSYTIHGRVSGLPASDESTRPSVAETSVKIRAIERHKTQLRLSRGRFLSFADRAERFDLSSANRPTTTNGPILSLARDSEAFAIDLRFCVKPFRSAPSIFFFGYHADGTLRCIAIKMPVRSGSVEMQDARSGEVIGRAEYFGHRYAGRLKIPAATFSELHSPFVKVERGDFWFFDEAGWLELPSVKSPVAALEKPRRRIPAPVASSIAGTDYPGAFAKAITKAGWGAVLAAVFIWLGLSLTRHINRPWIYALDFNGAVWSQSAHNILRAGLIETSGASSGFYFGPLPIPAWAYYLHHPPLLHLMLAGLFAVFGEHEWVARLLPISCSLASALLLWLLVRNSAGHRAATFSVAILACLPMELRYGKMVNFEPVVLMLILGALWAIQNWERSLDVRWKWAGIGLVIVGLWVDWAMYLFVLAWWICSRWRTNPKDRGLARTLLIIGIVSALLYLLRIQLLRQDAWSNLTQTFIYRMGGDNRSHFTEFDWLRKTVSSLGMHFFGISWILAMIGSGVTLLRLRRHEGMRFLGWACASIFVMDVVFLVAFQNDSYIHQYIGFYFLAPISILGGIALDAIVVSSRSILSGQVFAKTTSCMACVLLLLIGMQGAERTRQLEKQFQILDYKSREPSDLIPRLGAVIQQNFSADTRVLCNFLPDYGPQLEYYAQRELLNNLADYGSWDRYLHSSSEHIGGIVWMGSQKARDIVAKLPPGKKKNG